jgi:metal-dependent amidase/aminoacylase/carboxypeptidase family protein
MTTNVIPDTARVSTDVRTIDLAYMAELSAKLDAMAQGAALALGGVAEIDTEVGYLPFRQHRALSAPFREAFQAGVPGIAALLDDRGGSAAAGDVGDLSVMVPCIQIGYSGLEGTVHGADLRLDDPETVLDAVPRFLLEGLRRLGPALKTVATYRHTYEEYTAKVTSLGGTVG